MATDKTIDHNATPVDENDPLRGGTQGGRAGDNVRVGSLPGGTNTVSPAGSGEYIDRPHPGGGGNRTGDREEPESAFEGTRKVSAAEAKQWARDEADADTAPRTPHGAGEPRDHAIHKHR